MCNEQHHVEGGGIEEGERRGDEDEGGRKEEGERRVESGVEIVLLICPNSRHPGNFYL
jgi:hypothetical protein